MPISSDEDRALTPTTFGDDRLAPRDTLARVIATNAASAILMLDADGHPTFMNLAAEALTGFRLEEIRSRSLHYAIHHQRPDGSPYPHEECPIAQALTRREAIRRHEDHFLRKDGSRFPVLCFATPIIRSGEHLGTIFEFHDISEQKQAEAELRAAKEVAEAASRAKSDFLAIMSHELRTPLNAIAGYVELLESEIRGSINDDQRHDLLRIRENQRQLLSVINDILNFARLDAGYIQYAVTDVDIPAMFESLDAVMLPLVTAKRLSFRTRAAAGELRVRADADKVRQILVNLLTNAVKYTDAGGRIVLSCEALGRSAELRVSDTGRGIPADRLHAVFDPFVQVDPHLTRTASGVGLGLAISRDLARGMQGDLTVQSEVGVGSVFTLRLPLATSSQ